MWDKVSPELADVKERSTPWIHFESFHQFFGQEELYGRSELGMHRWEDLG